ncbi:DUF4907 domain-containing protein [Formosa sp. S-31]|uniref:DUF4907 domain-containing protein n=1 Tax=Formosa sp. S-31 TaxID=2790949 RepID=UPI003EBD1612
MQKRLKIILGLSVVCLLAILTHNSYKSKTSNYNIEVYPVTTGYGYKISVSKRVLIQQDVIPAIAENTAFCSSEDAKKTGLLVISKLEHKQNPRITKTELEALGVALNCIN